MATVRISLPVTIYKIYSQMSMFDFWNESQGEKHDWCHSTANVWIYIIDLIFRILAAWQRLCKAGHARTHSGTHTRTQQEMWAIAKGEICNALQICLKSLQITGPKILDDVSRAGNIQKLTDSVQPAKNFICQSFVIIEPQLNWPCSHVPCAPCGAPPRRRP